LIYRLSLFAALFAWLLFDLRAQQATEPGSQVIVHYRDGSVFHGQFIDQANGQVKLKLSTGDTIRLISHLVRRIDESGQKLWFKGLRQHRKEGIYVLFSGELGGDGDEYMAHGSLLGGYRITPKSSVGLGLAFSQGDARIGGNWITTSYIPWYVYGRHYFTDKRRRLYGFTKIGYGAMNEAAFGDEHTGGFFAQPGLGLHLATRMRFNWHFFLGQTLYNTSGVNRQFDQFGLPVTTEYNLWYNRWTFGFAIEIF
jgi:hypothetical protein